MDTATGFRCDDCGGPLGVEKTRRAAADLTVRYRKCRGCGRRSVTESRRVMVEGVLHSIERIRPTRPRRATATG